MIRFRPVKFGADPYLAASQQYNCLDKTFAGDSRWKVHQAGAIVGNSGTTRTVSKAMLEFPVFQVNKQLNKQTNELIEQLIE